MVLSLWLALLVVSNAAVTIAQATATTTTLPTLVLPSPTSIGNASNILTYPLCAQICANETIPGCNPNTIDCACGVTYRGQTAACEEVTCDKADYNSALPELRVLKYCEARTQILAQQLCGPLYVNNSILSSSVAVAIASATLAASTIVAGKDVTNPTSYPECAQNCYKEVGFFGCGSLANASCVCTDAAFNEGISKCEGANCSQADLNSMLPPPVSYNQEQSRYTKNGTVILDLAFVLCAPVGGLGANPPVLSPTIAPFKGAAASVATTGFGVLCMTVMGLLGLIVML
ncbi:hypothetical protein MMC13_008093 [Lambiella insularis]|nr:hypothetical protein [Lambiella insularis]